MAKQKPRRFPGIPYGRRLEAIGEELAQARSTRQEETIDRLLHALEMIKEGPDADGRTYAAIALLRGEDASQKNPAAQEQGRRTKPAANEVHALVQELLDYGDAQLGIVYSPKGIARYKERLAAIDAAAREGDPLEAWRSANQHYMQLWEVVSVGGAELSKNVRDVGGYLEKTFGRLCDIVRAKYDLGGWPNEEARCGQEMEVSLPGASLADVAHCVDMLGGYYSVKKWGLDNQVYLTPHSLEAQSTAIVEKEGNAFRITLISRPIKPFGVEDVVREVRAYRAETSADR